MRECRDDFSRLALAALMHIHRDLPGSLSPAMLERCEGSVSLREKDVRRARNASNKKADLTFV
jgi:hypothetical protein